MLRKSIFLILYLFFLVSNQSQVFGQTKEESITEYWLDVNIWHVLNDQWRVGGDLGARSFRDSDVNTFIIRPSVEKSLNSVFNLRGGMAYISSKTFGEKLNEFRLNQDVNINWPRLVGWNFKHRVRMEQRWIHTENETDFVFRSRARIGVEPPDLLVFELPMFMNVMWEFFMPLLNGNDNYVVNQRATGTIGARLSRKIRFESQYILQLGRSSQNDTFELNENVWRLRLHYLLDN